MPPETGPRVVLSGQHGWWHCHTAQASPSLLCSLSVSARKMVAGHLLPPLDFIFSLLHPKSSFHESHIGLAHILYHHGQIWCPGLWIHSLPNLWWLIEHNGVALHEDSGYGGPIGATTRSWWLRCVVVEFRAGCMSRIGGFGVNCLDRVFSAPAMVADGG